MLHCISGQVLVIDGGTGRELKALGAPFRQPEWSALALVEAPAFVTRVHERFAAAGARVLTTNSYAVVPFHIGEAAFAARGAELAALSGALARAVADAHAGVRVAGSLPPVSGSYRADLFDAAVSRRVWRVLVAALAPAVDVWLAETLSCVAEGAVAREVLDAAGGAAADKPLWLSFTLEDDGPLADAPAALRSGESVAAAIAAAVAARADAVLFNCSQPEVMRGAVAAAVAAAAALGVPALRVGAYANAFPPQRADAAANETLHATRAELTPAAYADFAASWVAAGATIVGGCCGVGAEHIAAVTAAVAPVACGGRDVEIGL